MIWNSHAYSLSHNKNKNRFQITKLFTKLTICGNYVPTIVGTKLNSKTKTHHCRPQFPFEATARGFGRKLVVGPDTIRRTLLLLTLITLSLHPGWLTTTAKLERERRYYLRKRKRKKKLRKPESSSEPEDKETWRHPLIPNPTEQIGGNKWEGRKNQMGRVTKCHSWPHYQK